MTANTDFYVCRIFKLLVRGYKPIINQHEVILGKTYRTVVIGNRTEKYKTIYNGSKGSLLLSENNGEYQHIDISRENTLFIMSLCRIYHKLLNNYDIKEKDNNI